MLKTLKKVLCLAAAAVLAAFLAVRRIFPLPPGPPPPGARFFVFRMDGKRGMFHMRRRVLARRGGSECPVLPRRCVM